MRVNEASLANFLVLPDNGYPKVVGKRLSVLPLQMTTGT